MKSFKLMIPVPVFMIALAVNAGVPRHTVSVSGSAEEVVAADAAYVTLYAQADGILMVDAVERADKMVEEITSAAMSGTDVIRSISVTDISLGERMQQRWGPDSQQESPRPQVARRIRITCEPKSLEIYEVIDNAIRAGALMSIPSQTHFSDDLRSVVVYGSENNSEVVDRVRRSAMSDARIEALKVAELAGKSVGDVVSIGCSGSSGSFPIRVMGRRPDFPAEYLGMDPDGITIRSSLAVTFELIEAE